MADNYLLPGHGVTVATSETNGVHTPVVSAALAGEASSYAPQYEAPSETGNASARVDPSRNLMVRSQVLTDEGSFRANFSGSSLAVTIGDCIFTNGNAIVTGTALTSYDLHMGDYVKLDADAESAWAQVDSIDSPTQLTLTEAYTGTGGSGASSCVIVKPVTGSGASITVTGGQATLALGTTATAITELERDVDYGPLLFQGGISVSQRIANQDIYIGLYDEEHSATPYYFAWFHLTGASATGTTVICESGGKRDGQPSGGEIETTTVTLPNGQTTATARRYRIEVLLAKLKFYIDGLLVAEHYKAMPRPMDLLTATVRCVNGTTPATGTSVVIDYLTTKNFNTLDITIPGETEGVVANTAPLEQMTYSVAGAITINTDLMIRDCSQCRAIIFQCTSMGTSGVITPAWSNNGVDWITATGFNESGSSSTTVSAAGLRYYSVIARYFRLRLTTGASGGTTTFSTQCSQQTIQSWLATQPVSGTVTANVGTLTSASASARNSTADTNLANIKNAAGSFYGITCFNNGASTAYVKLYNKTSAPVLASDTPVMVFIVPATSNKEVTWALPGYRFATGLSIAITGGIADNDTTAVAAGQVKTAVSYI